MNYIKGNKSQNWVHFKPFIQTFRICWISWISAWVWSLGGLKRLGRRKIGRKTKLFFKIWNVQQATNISHIMSVSNNVATDRPARRGAWRPPCCTQMWMVSVITVTDDGHQFSTLTIHLSWQHQRRSTVPEIWLVPTKI